MLMFLMICGSWSATTGLDLITKQDVAQVSLRRPAYDQNVSAKLMVQSSKDRLDYYVYWDIGPEEKVHKLSISFSGQRYRESEWVINFAKRRAKLVSGKKKDLLHKMLNSRGNDFVKIELHYGKYLHPVVYSLKGFREAAESLKEPFNSYLKNTPTSPLKSAN